LSILFENNITAFLNPEGMYVFIFQILLRLENLFIKKLFIYYICKQLNGN